MALLDDEHVLTRRGATEADALIEQARQRRRRRWWSIATAVLLVAVAGGIAVSLGSPSVRPPARSTTGARPNGGPTSPANRTASARTCRADLATTTSHLVMPSLTRFTTTLRLRDGESLAPAPAGYVARASSKSAWRDLGLIKETSATYQVFLARYWSPFGAGPDGAQFAGQVVWVVMGKNLAYVPDAPPSGVVPKAAPARQAQATAR